MKSAQYQNSSLLTGLAWKFLDKQHLSTPWTQVLSATYLSSQVPRMSNSAAVKTGSSYLRVFFMAGRYVKRDQMEHRKW